MKIVSLISVLSFLIFINITATDLSTNKDSTENQSSKSIITLICRGNQIFWNKKRLSFEEVEVLYEDLPEISNLYISGYKTKNTGKALTVLGIFGTSLSAVLISIGQINNSLNRSSEADLAYAAGITSAIICVPMIPVSIVLKIMGTNKIASSVYKYNQLQSGSSSNSMIECNFGLTNSGIGFQVRF